MVLRTAIRTAIPARGVRASLWLLALAGGLALGFLPDLAWAAEPATTTFEAADRGMTAGEDWSLIFGATILGVLALFALSGIGYLYRRERGLDWEFQKPDAPHDDHH